MCNKKKLEIEAQKHTYMIDDSVILTQIVTVEKIEEHVSLRVVITFRNNIDIFIQIN